MATRRLLACITATVGGAPQPTTTTEEHTVTTTEPTTRYIATFDPQAWINDYAVSVDPQGPTEWEVTEEVTRHADYFAELFATEVHNGEVIDNDDVLRDDSAAPGWVQNWGGPFTITVRAVNV